MELILPNKLRGFDFSTRWTGDLVFKSTFRGKRVDLQSRFAEGVLDQPIQTKLKLNKNNIFCFFFIFGLLLNFYKILQNLSLIFFYLFAYFYHINIQKKINRKKNPSYLNNEWRIFQKYLIILK